MIPSRKKCFLWPFPCWVEGFIPATSVQTRRALSASFSSEAKSKASFCSYDKAIQKKITPLPRPSHLIEQHLYSSYLLVSQSYPGEDLCLSLLSCPETDWSNHITLSSPACQRTTKCCFVVCLFLLKCHYSLLVTFKNQAIARSMQLCLLYFRD